jgi:hypothetical protein
MNPHSLTPSDFDKRLQAAKAVVREAGPVAADRFAGVRAHRRRPIEPLKRLTAFGRPG